MEVTEGEQRARRTPTRVNHNSALCIHFVDLEGSIGQTPAWILARNDNLEKP